MFPAAAFSSGDLGWFMKFFVRVFLLGKVLLNKF